MKQLQSLLSCIINQVAGNLLTHIYFSHFTYTNKHIQLRNCISTLHICGIYSAIGNFFLFLFHTLLFRYMYKFYPLYIHFQVHVQQRHLATCIHLCAAFIELCGVEIEQTKKEIRDCGFYFCSRKIVQSAVLYKTRCCSNNTWSQKDSPCSLR